MSVPDYIIIGSGPAGSVLAARLSEDPSVQVLLLEAGGSDRSLMIDMPAAIPFVYQNKKLSWGEMAGPEPHLEGLTIDEKRGKVLGGSTSINAMLFNRGNPRDFDNWRDLGLSGWGWNDVLPYFRRMETFSEGENETRGGSGPLKVTRCPARHRLFDIFMRSGEQAGHHTPIDHNSGDQEGMHIAQAMIDNGRRCSAAKAYLHPNIHRSNLTVRTGANVHRVLFDGEQAVGVQLVSGERIEARREVLVAASTIGAAKLLMLSGVGPADSLRANGIDVVIDHPHVGKNLENHPGVNLQYACDYKDSLVSELNLIGRARLGGQWLLSQTGLGASNFFEAGAFLKTHDKVDYPNVQFEFLPLARYIKNGRVKAIPGYQLWIDLSRPHSRGYVTLASSDPLQNPDITFNHLAEEEDRRDIVRSVRLARDIFAQSAWSEIRGRAIQPDESLKTDAEILSWAKSSIGTSYHPSGTCRMATTIRDGVVDEQCRVHGVRGLRVVGPAVMPRIVAANLSAATYMISEKVSDHIRQGI